VDPNEELVAEYAIHPTQLGKTQSVAQWPVRTTSNQQTIAENGKILTRITTSMSPNPARRFRQKALGQAEDEFQHRTCDWLPSQWALYDSRQLEPELLVDVSLDISRQGIPGQCLSGFAPQATERSRTCVRCPWCSPC
jgi:hypothetical protein